ncbi:hypothetical protein ACE0DR_06130 [Azotobacter sp. CWF10]
MAGLPLDLFNREAIAGFVIHHEAKGLAKTEREWLAALVNWVKRDAVQAAARPAAVVSFPGKVSAVPTGRTSTIPAGGP